MMKMTKKAKNAKVFNALCVLVFTEATYAWLHANDPQALKQALGAFTLGDVGSCQADFLGRMRAKYGTAFLD